MNSIVRKEWTKEELLLAINLYCKTPFGKIHTRNPDIIDLSHKLGRSPGSISYKLANFASIDPSLDRKGASNVSKLDKEVWNEFFENWDDMIAASEVQLMRLEQNDEKQIIIDRLEGKEGKDRQYLTKTRINQSFFRQMILASYDNACCITGINLPELLVASHIIPWSCDQKNRLNPRNGLCLNALHDRAFDCGLITFDDDYRIVLSPRAKAVTHSEDHRGLLSNFEGRRINMPSRFIPDQCYLEFHRQNIFQS